MSVDSPSVLFFLICLALKKIRDGPGELGDAAVSTALQGLREVLNRGDLKNEHRIPSKSAADNNKFVDIFITFDEAHTLSEYFDELTEESRFIAL
jgi:hypothetical protein